MALCQINVSQLFGPMSESRMPQPTSVINHENEWYPDSSSRIDFIFHVSFHRIWLSNNDNAPMRATRQQQMKYECFALLALCEGNSSVTNGFRPQRPVVRNVLARHAAIMIMKKSSFCLTHWGRDKMPAILQTTFSTAFSWMKMYEFRLRFHCSLFLRIQLTISQHRFR